jgi:hypothetical protein
MEVNDVIREDWRCDMIFDSHGKTLLIGWKLVTEENACAPFV